MKQLFVDLEATCWGDGSYGRGHTEIIQIGALLCENAEFIKGYNFYVKPINSKLSEFCKRLTGINQAQIDSADNFRNVLYRLTCDLDKMWDGRGSVGIRIYCWGDYDVVQLMQDCGRHGVKYPFGYEYTNVKRQFKEKHKAGNLWNAMREIKMFPFGISHDGFDDAVNAYRVYRYLHNLPDIKKEDICSKVMYE